MIRRIPVSDGVLSVSDTGHPAAPPLVLLHGMVASSFSWRHLAPELATRFRVFSIDAVAHGDSQSGPGCDFCLTGHAKRVLQVLHHLSLACCICIATSYGGAVALEAAVLDPRRFERLVLVAPAHPFASQPMFVARLYSTAMGRAIGHTYPYLPGQVFRWGLGRMFANPGKCSPEIARGYQAGIRRSGHIAGMLESVRSYRHDMQNLRDQLPGIADIPVRLIWGERDPVVPIQTAQELLERFRNARLLTMPGIGHLPYEEAPEQFAAAINESLAD